MINLRCDIAIPSGLRRSRVFARLDDYDHETLVLSQARGAADATHQVVDACGQPLITFLSERDPGVATDLIRAGFWELPETVAVLLAVRPGAQVIDAGAHVGFTPRSWHEPPGEKGESMPSNPIATTSRHWRPTPA